MEELYKVEKIDDFNWSLHYKDKRQDIHGNIVEMEVRSKMYSENNIHAEIKDLNRQKDACDARIAELTKELEEIQKLK